MSVKIRKILSCQIIFEKDKKFPCRFSVTSKLGQISENECLIGTKHEKSEATL